MTVLHLHVGMHKTGTSAFQNACGLARGALLSEGFNYHVDSMGRIFNHSYFRDVIERRGTGALEPVLRESFSANGSQNYVISGEDISYLEMENLNRLVALFREFFADVHVYAVLRAPIGYMHSATQEILKNPVTDVAGLFQRWDVTPSYELRFRKFIDIFGRSHVHLLGYEAGVLRKLAHLMGIKAPLVFNADNQSTSRWVMKMAAALKPFETWQDADAAIEKLKARDTSPSERDHAPIELVKHWASRIAKDRAWLESIWTPPAGFFDEPPPTVPRSYYETFSIEEVQILRSLSV